MKLKKSDLPLLGKSLAFLVFAMLLSLTSSILARQFLRKMEDKAHASEKSLVMMEDRIRQARQGGMGASRAAYTKLSERGAFREFKRIDLVEHLERIGPMLRDLQYSIFPRQTISTSGLAMNLNRAHFQMSLLHEGKLLDFLDALESQKNGIPLIAGCGIERISDHPAFESNLKAECTVIWMTLEEEK